MIDDSYNANPDSVRAAIDVLAASGGRTVLVLGDMGEVGDMGPDFQLEGGREARQRGGNGRTDARRGSGNDGMPAAEGEAAALVQFGHEGRACIIYRAVMGALISPAPRPRGLSRGNGKEDKAVRRSFHKSKLSSISPIMWVFTSYNTKAMKDAKNQDGGA